jgi:hypothetical protein
MTRAWHLGRRGISLPLVIFLMSLLALAVTVGFARVSDERRIVGDQQAQIDAFAVAESGLERYLAMKDSNPGTYDSVTMPVGTRDTAFVVVWQIRAGAPGLPAIYLVRSRGLGHSGRRYDAVTPPAQRTVAQYATWQDASFDLDAAWTSLAGLSKDGNAGTLSGNDACGVESPIIGVGVPTQSQSGFSGYRQTPPPGTPVVPQGSPVGVDSNVGGMGSTPWSAEGTVAVDWSGIVGGTSLVPDYALTSTSGWPGSFTNWPVIVVTAATISLSAAETGQGILVVTGDAVFDGGFTWLGPVLVGGQASILDATVRGAVVSGLNFKLGTPANDSDAGPTVNVQYDSCTLDSALVRFAHLRPLANAWTDSWPEN